jgi:hypothetical protein
VKLLAAGTGFILEDLPHIAARGCLRTPEERFMQRSRGDLLKDNDEIIILVYDDRITSGLGFQQSPSL